MREEVSLTDIDARRYFERIGYAGSTAPTLATLRQLHAAHLIKVPFENLSVRRGEPIALEPAPLFEKIVLRRRGGFCYELNGLFAALLESLGFRVSRLAGRVGPAGIPFDHMALRVDLDEPWLAELERWPLSAFEGGCRYHQTSPKSSFTQKTVISRATETGRITLSERRLIVTSQGQRSETDLDDDASVSRALAEHFGIR